MQMNAAEAVRFQKELRDANSMFSNWVHSATTEQKKLLHEALGGVNKFPWSMIEENLKTMIRGADMTSYRLNDVLDKAKVDI